jgi:parallel beta-helix repeat protein
MVSEETSVGDVLSVEVTPNNPTGDGISVLSNSLTITGTTPPPSDTTPPSTPTGLQATVVSDSRIDLTWNVASDNVGVTGYNIYRGGVKIGTAAGTSYSNAGLSAGTSYTYRVSAFDAAGNEGGLSTEVTATTTTTPPPTSCDVTFSPGDSVASTVSASPEGSVFCFNPGIYREVSITPRNGDSFIGGDGVVLSGAKLLDPNDFVFEGGYWVISGQTQNTPGSYISLWCTILQKIDFLNTPGAMPFVHPRATSTEKYTLCDRTEDLFIDDLFAWRLENLADLGSGAWVFDKTTDKIYIADNPAGKKIETSTTVHAFTRASVDNVVIDGFVIEKYAPRAQDAPVHSGNGNGWRVENNEVRFNHGMGLRVGGNNYVFSNNHIHHNGQLGLGGGGQFGLVENNEISYNSVRGYNPGWEGGATKFAWTTNLTVRGNFVHHNNAGGLWTDINNINTLYENNIIEDNPRGGIHHEVSYAAVIRNNTIRRNSFGQTGWIGKCGIMIAESPDVEIYDNIIHDNYGGVCAKQQNRTGGAYGPYEVWNLYVHDNDIRMIQGYTGMAQDYAPHGADSLFTSQNNRFENNHYTLGSNSRYFAWMHGFRTEAEWVAYGNDDTGSFTRI